MKIKICYTWTFSPNKNDYPENYTKEDILKQELETAKDDPYILLELSDAEPLDISGEIIE